MPVLAMRADPSQMAVIPFSGYGSGFVDRPVARSEAGHTRAAQGDSVPARVVQADAATRRTCGRSSAGRPMK